MKKLFNKYCNLIIVAAILYFLTFCSNNSENSNSTNINKVVSMEHLTKETFKEKVFNYEKNKEWKYEGSLPCIVDFYADWCGPCKMISPVLEELSNEYKGKLLIYKVNTDEQHEIAEAFGIQSIPSLLFCPKSGQPQMLRGAMSKQSFEKNINELLLDKKSNAVSVPQ